MASLHRAPLPALRGLVASIWSHDAAPAAPRPGAREHVLPSGATHLALRIGGPPIHVFEHAGDPAGHRLGHAVVGGARTAYHVRDVSQPAISVGAVLRPGAAAVVLGAPESALAGHHTPLALLVGAGEVDRLLQHLGACPDAAARLRAFESWLCARSGGVASTVHPALAGLLLPGPARPGPWHPGLSAAALVAASGLSHRHCIAHFRHATGLLPREWLRLRRFARALELAEDAANDWAGIAAASGFADQAHLANTFRAVAGCTPSAWRRDADPAAPRHLPR